MLVIPAIDLKQGCVVRLVEGRFKKKIYSRDPLKTARRWEEEGAEFLHLVDLDGAMSGRPRNLGIVKEIANKVGVPVECGGGIRNIRTIKSLLNSGIARVVLGTRVATDREFLRKALKQFGDKVIVSVDARDNNVCIRGWKDRTGINAASFIKDLKKTGLRRIIYTDISKDGTLKGPNLKSIRQILKDTGIKMIASGGISALSDIRRIKALEKEGVIGIIIGKALYERRFTLTRALKLV
ncbi:MAG: 1-(5-phosphoribosyl)-5-[(5-phosphoribosylamino)methylideneamino]imidazole-4-carboxamide isomerase [Candidatus Omnitrophota bacterium]|jgi:phosphoribosylformimino-5-aminoimidazole carboxamide ribotide isomerase